MYKINNEFTVFGKKVELNTKELSEYKNRGLEINNDILEFCLMHNDIYDIGDKDPDSIRELCKVSLEKYAEYVTNGTKAAIKEGF